MSVKDEREYGWFDEEDGSYYYLNRFYGFRFQPENIPEDYRDKPEPTDVAKDMLKGLLGEPARFETERVEELTLKQIAERTESSGDGKSKMRYVRLGRSAFNPRYLKEIRRTFKDAMWYVRPDNGELSKLYIVDPYSSQVVGVLLPMRVQKFNG